ncbi:unnamed protein product [Ranitomeya imitator]|uniref:Uncharacterized protein n=1 Tax=Ranitomeya imitator TaxID=111125 RepID=A0ABN9MNC4_9NEOB|nr:unnamed protein product [Ranitomeya imitator]
MKPLVGKGRGTVEMPDDTLSLGGLGLYGHSDFVPPEHDPVIETFSKLVKADLNKLRKRNLKVNRSNFNASERREIRALKENKAITIKQADKGGAIVVMDTPQYRGKILNHLSDPEVYEKLPLNPTQSFMVELGEIIDEACVNGIIDEKLAKYLKATQGSIGRL